MEEVEGPMRAYVGKGEIKPVAPYYEEGESVYIAYENAKKGTFLVTIASNGRWNKAKQDVEYQVKQTDGTLYKSGEWVLEKTLKDK